MDALEVWDKVERSAALNRAAKPTASASDTEDKSDSEAKRLRRRRIFRALDVVATIFWAYALLKVFVTDFDRSLMERVAPGFVSLLQYRLLFFVAVAAGMAVAAKWFPAFIAYVVFFPLVIVGWKLPRLLYRHRSWGLLMRGLNVLTMAFSNFRRNFILKCLTLIATVLILTTRSPALLVPSLLVIAGVLLHGYWRGAIQAARPSNFISIQQELVSRAVDSPRVEEICAISDDLKREDIEVYSPEQVSRFAIGLSVSLTLPKALHLWAFQLQEYRKTAAPLFLSLASYLWLFLGSLFGLTLLNLGILHLAPEQFTFRSPPSNIALVVYSMNTMAFSEGGGLSAAGDLALALQLVANFLVPVILVGFLLNLFLTIRRERDEAASRSAIETLRKRAKEREDAIVREYQVTQEEALDRLESVGYAFSWLLTLLAVSIPDDYLDTPQDP